MALALVAAEDLLALDPLALVAAEDLLTILAMAVFVWLVERAVAVAEENLLALDPLVLVAAGPDLSNAVRSDFGIVGLSYVYLSCLGPVLWQWPSSHV
jgi:hypothetical protein